MAFSKTKLLWAVFLLGTVLDGITTVYLVSLYGIEHEANLIARAFMERWGPVWGTIYHNLWGVGLVVSLWLLTYVSVERWRWWDKVVKTLRESLEVLMVFRMLAPINNLAFALVGVALIDLVGFTELVFTSALGLILARRLWRF